MLDFSHFIKAQLHVPVIFFRNLAWTDSRIIVNDQKPAHLKITNSSAVHMCTCAFRVQYMNTSSGLWSLDVLYVCERMHEVITSTVNPSMMWHSSLCIWVTIVNSRGEPSMGLVHLPFHVPISNAIIIRNVAWALDQRPACHGQWRGQTLIVTCCKNP